MTVGTGAKDSKIDYKKDTSQGISSGEEKVKEKKDGISIEWMKEGSRKRQEGVGMVRR